MLNWIIAILLGYKELVIQNYRLVQRAELYKHQ